MAKSQIIIDLANSVVDTETALKRTKVLLQGLEDKKLLQWIDYELEGYPNDTDIPEYRKINGQLYGSYFKGSMASHVIYTDVPLPLGKMPTNERERILTTSITQGIGALKDMLEKSGNNGLVRAVPAELYPYIAKYNNDPYMIITSAHVRLNMPEILNISSKIENRLLDVLFYLEKQFGNLDQLDIDIDGKTKEERKKIINEIYVIIYNNRSITLGDNNTLKNTTIASTIDKR